MGELPSRIGVGKIYGGVRELRQFISLRKNLEHLDNHDSVNHQDVPDLQGAILGEAHTRGGSHDKGLQILQLVQMKSHVPLCNTY